MTGDRLDMAANGRVVLRLRHPWADGTVHVAIEPTEFLEAGGARATAADQPAALSRRLAAHASWRAEVVAASGKAAATSPGPAAAARLSRHTLYGARAFVAGAAGGSSCQCRPPAVTGQSAPRPAGRARHLLCGRGESSTNPGVTVRQRRFCCPLACS